MNDEDAIRELAVSLHPGPPEVASLRARVFRGALALAVASWIAACAGTIDIAAGPVPPPFSRRIASAFPGAPFITCELGQFEDTRTDGSSEPQRWYVRSASGGELRVDLHALETGPGEGGGLSARLYDPGGAALGEVSVSFHPGPSEVASLRARVSGGRIYRLDVRRTATTGAPGHHYRLALSGIPVEIGLSSPALPRWFEGRNLAPQVFHVHLDAGEALRIAVAAGEGQPIPTMTVELRDGYGALLGTTTSSTRDPFDVELGPGAARTLRVITFGNHHFTLDKRSGADRGIYVDTCPPAAAPR